MAKEIYEQPEVVGHTLTQYIDMVGRPRLRQPFEPEKIDWKNAVAALHLGLRHGLLLPV